MWASPRVVKISVWMDESQRRVQRKKWKWVNRGREICCICLNLRAIRFRTNSGGALSPAFGQFMVADTSHLGQRQSIKAIWKRVSPKQPVKLGDHPSTSWFVAALLFHSTSVCMMWDYSPITSLPGMHIESKIRGKKTLLKQSGSNNNTKTSAAQLCCVLLKSVQLSVPFNWRMLWSLGFYIKERHLGAKFRITNTEARPNIYPFFYTFYLGFLRSLCALPPKFKSPWALHFSTVLFGMINTAKLTQVDRSWAFCALWQQDPCT